MRMPMYQVDMEAWLCDTAPVTGICIDAEVMPHWCWHLYSFWSVDANVHHMPMWATDVRPRENEGAAKRGE
jgi:hypothetical protein